MRIYIPFTHLRSETYLACIRAAGPGGTNIIPIGDHEWGYADYWIEQWQKGETFINVEHDVVPRPEALIEMWDCPEPYCLCNYIYPYAESPVETSPIGCAKFSSDFIGSHQGIFVRHLHWHDPQHVIIAAGLNKFHLHEPPALHLHVNENWPTDARRRYGLTYLGETSPR